MLRMSDQTLEDLSRRITYTEELSPELVNCIKQVCVDLEIPGGCQPEKAGSTRRGTGVAGLSDIDIWVRSPEHKFTRRERMEFAHKLEEKAKAMGLIDGIFHVGKKSIKLSLPNSAPLDVVLLDLAYDADLEEVHFPEIIQERADIEQFYCDNCKAQDVVKLLKLAFHDTKKVRGSLLEKALWRTGLDCDGLKTAFRMALQMIEYWRASLIILEILDDEMRRLQDDNAQNIQQFYDIPRRLDSMAANIPTVRRAKESVGTSDGSDFIRAQAQGKNVPPHRESSPEYRSSFSREADIVAGRLIYKYVARDATPIWYWREPTRDYEWWWTPYDPTRSLTGAKAAPNAYARPCSERAVQVGFFKDLNFRFLRFFLWWMPGRPWWQPQFWYVSDENVQIMRQLVWAESHSTRPTFLSSSLAYPLFM